MPETAISINIEKMTVSTNTTENPNVVSLNCCAMKTVQGLSSNPIVVWYGPDGDGLSANSMSAAPVVTRNKTCVELQLTASRGNVYVCKATLQSPVMEQPLVKTAMYRQGMQLVASNPGSQFWFFSSPKLRDNIQNREPGFKAMQLGLKYLLFLQICLQSCSFLDN